MSAPVVKLCVGILETFFHYTLVVVEAPPNLYSMRAAMGCIQCPELRIVRGTVATNYERTVGTSAGSSGSGSGAGHGEWCLL